MTTSNPFAPPGADEHPGRPPAGQPYPAQPFGSQPYPAQPFGSQPYPAQPYASQPVQPYPVQPFPGPSGQPYQGSTLRPVPYVPARQLPTGLALGSLFTGLGALVIGVPFTLGVGGVVGGLVGLVLGVVALRRVRAGTGGGRGYAVWGVVTSLLASVAGVGMFAALAPDAAESFQEGWDEAAAEAAEAEAPGTTTSRSAWDDGFDAGYEDGYEDGYVGARYPVPAPGTEDSPVDPADVPQHLLGEAGSVGVYAVTVLAVNLDADDVVVPAFPGNLAPEGRYVLATVSVTNVGTTPARPAADLYHYYPGDDDLLYGDWSCTSWTPRPVLDVGALAPGATVEYDVCFDVPTHALGSPGLMVDDARSTEYRLTQWSAPEAA